MKWMLARLWAWGQRDWSTPSFGGHLNPIPTKVGLLMPTMYNDVPKDLKATAVLPGMYHVRIIAFSRIFFTDKIDSFKVSQKKLVLNFWLNKKFGIRKEFQIFQWRELLLDIDNLGEILSQSRTLLDQSEESRLIGFCSFGISCWLQLGR